MGHAHQHNFVFDCRSCRRNYDGKRDPISRCRTHDDRRLALALFAIWFSEHPGHPEAEKIAHATVQIEPKGCEEHETHL